MNRKVLLGGAVLLLIAIVSSTDGRPEGPSPVESTTSTADASGAGTTAVPEEESKVSKFFDDVSSAFKTGTAKVKESFESAATSVKDGVLRGYGFVKDKFTGNGDVATDNNNGTSVVSTVATTSVANGESKTVSARSIGSSFGALTTAKAIKVEPNDEETKDDDRLIFISDEDTGTDGPVTATPAPTTLSGTTSPSKTNLDDRFIIDGPQACKKGQSVVNGVCRNTF